MHDRVRSVDGRPQGRGVDHVALDQLAARERGPLGAPHVAHEAANAYARAPQGGHDVAADEPGAARDEDHPEGV